MFLRQLLAPSFLLVAFAACGPSRPPVNPCEDVTCSGHGKCTAPADAPVCVCDAGFTASGTECLPPDPCAGVTCSGHGACAVGDAGAACTCAEGFHAAGLECLSDVDPCAGVTCSDRGTCRVEGAAARCECQAGFHANGLACVTDGDACTGVTCSGHGTCLVQGTTASCECAIGFHNGTGLQCVADVGPCANVTCSGHGTCREDGSAPVCECASGFHSDGLACIANDAPCTGVTCSDHGNCVESGGVATCACASGFHTNGLACVPDSNPCEGVLCSSHGDCVASGTALSCACDAGFHAEGLTCVPDVDPCLGISCSNHGRCQVSASTAACVCDAGFHSEGTTCVADLDPCAGVACSGHGTCRVSGGAALCVCAVGYFAQGLNCEIEDPCAGVTCAEHELCSAGVCGLRPGRCAGAADCTSPKTCDAQHTCVEAANPCAGVACSGHGTCDASTGTATCRCDQGYVANGLTCASPANPCDGVTCSSHGTCAVSGSSPVCVCADGYLASGLSCVASPCNGVTCSSHGTCVVSGTSASCSCAAGFHSDGLTCVADSTACAGVTCSGHGTCGLVSGAAKCTCDAGWDANGTTCVQHVAAGDLVLSELMPDPSVTTDALGEWIEIYNPTDHAIVLADLSIRVGATSVTSVPLSTSLASHAHFVVARSVDAKVAYGATASFSNLANGGGKAAVLVRGQVIDEVTYPAASAGKSFQLSLPAYASAAHADFANWCLATKPVGGGNADLGTPGTANSDCGVVTDPCTGVTCNHGFCVAAGASASCSCDGGWSGAACNTCAVGFHSEAGACVPNVAPTGLVISEYLASPAALPDTTGEWVELRNNGVEAIPLDTLEIIVDTTSYPIGQAGKSIPPGGHFLLARSAQAPLPIVGAIMSLSLPSSGTHTLGLKLSGVAVGAALPITATAGVAWQLDAGGTWCAARTPIGAGNGDLGTPGSLNPGCVVSCVDRDGDGHSRVDATLCPAGDDFCDGDPARFTSPDCAACTEGALRPGTEACGPNFDGVYHERCHGGRWSPAASCTSTAVCVEGQVRSAACNLPVGGTYTLTCTGGTWVGGACSADECGTTLRTGDVTIKNVTDIAALAGVSSIDGTLTIQASDRVNLTGLAALRCVKGLTIASNQYLQNLGGLDGLVRVGGALTITSNSILTSLGGLAAVRSAGSVRIEGNNGLTDANLAALSTVNGDLRIVNQYSLTAITGLRALRYVAGQFDVSTNRLLTSVATSGLLRSTGGLRFVANPELRSLDGLLGLAAVFGDVYIDGNLHVYFEITGGPHFTYLKGTMVIANNKSMDTILGGFAPLRQIGGDLIIRDNTLTRHFAGFANLRSIGGALVLTNSVIYDVTPLFPNLRVIDGDVRLTTLGFIGAGVGMPKLERIGGSCTSDNGSPDEWNGLDSLRIIGGDYVLKNSSQLQKLHLPALQRVIGSFRVQASGASALYRYNAMFTDVAKLEEVGGTFELSGLESVNVLTGLEKLAKVGGGLSIENNRYLTSIAGLGAVRWIGGDLRIRSNALTSIRPLQPITHLGGNLVIQEGVPHCEAIALKDHLILDTGWTGTATISGTNVSGVCP